MSGLAEQYIEVGYESGYESARSVITEAYNSVEEARNEVAEAQTAVAEAWEVADAEKKKVAALSEACALLISKVKTQDAQIAEMRQKIVELESELAKMSGAK